MRTDDRFDNQGGRSFDKPRPQREGAFSIARLAAEAAFAPAPFPAPPDDKPVVRVLTARVPKAEPETGETQVMGVVPAAGKRGPRVFRIGDSTPTSEPVVQSAVEQTHAPRRRSKVKEGTRPGPVLQIVRTPPDSSLGERNDALAHGQEEGGRSTTLRLALRTVEPVFQDIEFAQAFDISAGRQDQAWQRLDDAVAELAAQLHQASAI